MKETLIYVMDPLCGWSYGNSANIVAVYEELKEEYDFEILSGGIKIGDEIESGNPDMCTYIRSREKQIAKLTNACISEKFYKQIASNPGYVFDSTPPSRAIAAIKLIDNAKAIPYAHHLQEAYFIEGKNINNIDVVSEVAIKIGIDKRVFIETYNSSEADVLVQADYKRARMMKVNCFPSIYLTLNDNLIHIEKGLMPVENIRQSLSFCFKPL